MAILAVSDYPSIRSAIDVSLDAHKLPDSVIEDDLFLEAGQQDVLSRYPDAEDEVDAVKIIHIRNAAVNFVAARMVPSLRQITSINTQINGTSHTTMTYDPVKKRKQLMDDAMESLALALGETNEPEQRTRVMPTIFRVASGKRGRL